MYNNTNTLSTRYNSSSLFGDVICYSQKNKIKSHNSEKIENPYFDFTKFYSFELRKQEIFELLDNYFEFETSHDELDYLTNNVEICQILSGLAKYIKSSFDINSKLVLELMNEGNNWKTLFVNIYSQMDWEKSNTFYDNLLDTLLDINPKLVNIINFNFNPQ